MICSEPELSTTQPQCLCRRESGFSTHPASRRPESSCLKAAQSCSGPVWMTAGEIFSIHSPVWQFGQLQTLPKLSEPVSVLGNFPACKFPMQQNQQSSGHFFCVSYRNSRLRKELCTVRLTLRWHNSPQVALPLPHFLHIQLLVATVKRTQCINTGEQAASKCTSFFQTGSATEPAASCSLVQKPGLMHRDQQYQCKICLSLIPT